MKRIGSNEAQNKSYTWLFTIVIALLIGLYVSFLQIPKVEAHAALIEMTPSEKVVTEDSPGTLELRFNEPIEKELATVTLYDWNAKPVFTGNPEDDEPSRAPLLEFPLPELKKGTYTVKWNVVSSDGHPVEGSYSFAVGEPTEGGEQSVSEGGESESLLIVTRTIAQGLLLVGAGLFWFSWLAARRNYPSLDMLWKRGRCIGAMVIVFATVAELITYATALPPGLIPLIFKGRWDILLQFPFVLMVFVQLIFILLLFIPGMVRGWYLFMWMALVVIPSFGGHVWGMKSPIMALIPRIIHQLTIALWLGALCYVILITIWQKKQNEHVSWSKFRTFFVKRMIFTTSLVVVSGVLMVFLQTGWIAVFTDWKNWSTLLVIKIILTTFMLSLALFQTLKWKRREKFTTLRIIRIEWIVGLLVIALGVWLSQIAYPIAVESYEDALTDDQVTAEVNIGKLQTGEQKMTAKISTVDGEQPDELIVEVSMPHRDTGSGPMTAELDETGNYIVELPFSMSGTWLLDITANYPKGIKKEWTDEIFIDGEGNN